MNRHRLYLQVPGTAGAQPEVVVAQIRQAVEPRVREFRRRRLELSAPPPPPRSRWRTAGARGLVIVYSLVLWAGYFLQEGMTSMPAAALAVWITAMFVAVLVLGGLADGKPAPPTR